MNELCFRKKGGKSYIPNDTEKLSPILSDVQHRKGESAFRIQQFTRDKRWSTFSYAVYGTQQRSPTRTEQQIAQKRCLPLKYINK